MARLTKSQQKRLARDINAKAKKLFMVVLHGQGRAGSHIVSVSDMAAIERLTTKWLKRIG